MIGNAIGNSDEKINDCIDLIYNSSNKNETGFITVILGAGASASLGTEALIGALTSGSREMFDINAMVHFGKDSKKCTLEELFSIYSKINGEKSVHDFLSDRRIFRRVKEIRPTKGYEFLAHLVHYKLIDNIITTNFDEELEISLDDEIGSDNYINIKSLSEFDAFNMEIVEQKKKLKKPVLFKIHGTISYPRTIRATIENVRRFEDEKLKAIKWLICNTKILIIIGYSFKDKDFEHAFSEAVIEKNNKNNPDKLKIFWIYRNNSSIYEDFITRLSRKRKFAGGIEEPSFIAIDANDFLKKLSENIERKDNNTRIATTARQNLRNLILEYSSPDHILEKKFYIEVIIFALTAKGLFGASALKDCIRVQRYCRELMNGEQSPYDLLCDLENAGIIKRLNERSEIYFLPDEQIDEIVEKVIAFFELKESNRTSIAKYLSDLEKVFDVDIIAPDESTYLMFKDPEPILDHEHWGKATEDLIRSSNTLRIIAQTGEWLTKDKNKTLFTSFFERRGKIELITCQKFSDAGMHTKRQNEIEKTLNDMKSNGSLEIRYLPWELISEHIKFGNKMGMYMKRIAKSSIVAPLLIKQENDLELLKNKFNYYWQTALVYPKWSQNF